MAPASDAGPVPAVRIAVAGTAIFAVTQTLAAIAPRGTTGLVAVVWSLVLFVVGSVAFCAAFVVAAGRSRDERVTVVGVVWLTDVAPVAVARALRIALVAQCVVALVTAGIRPFSAVAFGILAPMFGLGCIAWFGARHGIFAPIVTSTAASSATPRAAATATPPRTDPGDVAVPDDGADGDRSDPDDFDQLFRRRGRRKQ